MPGPAAPAAGRWEAVPRFLLRSAGFGYGLVDLRRPALVSALLDRRRRAAAVDAVRAEWHQLHFPRARAALQADGADRAAFAALHRAARDVDRSRAPRGGPGPASGAGWTDRWAAALDQLAAADQRVDAEAAQALGEGRRALRGLLGDPGFLAALTASNPGAAERVVLALRADPDGRRSATRQHERLVYAYAQRLATKNETTAFFGPIDYGTLGGDRAGGGVRLRYAGRPLQARVVRLSHWAVQEIADRVAAVPAVAARLPLRLRAGCWVRDGTLVVATSDRQVPLPAEQAGLLAAVAGGPERGLHELPAAESRLARELLDRGLLTTELLVPAALDDPAGWLADRLAAFEADGITGAGTWRLLLDRLRAGAAELGGVPDAQREPVLRETERAFSAGTGRPARRGAGQHYADRLVVGEDCRGGVAECVLSDAAAVALVGRLAPVLSLCASYSVVVQQAVLRRAAALHRRLGGGPVGYLRFVTELDRAEPMSGVLADAAVLDWLRQLDGVVGAATTGGEARTGTAGLRPLLREVPDGTLVSPDVLLGADPARPGTALADVPLVLGEVHHGAQVWTHLTGLDPELDRTGADVAALLRAGDPDLASVLHRRTQGKAFEREVAGTAVEFRTRAALRHRQLLLVESLQVRAAGDGLGLVGPGGRPLRLRARHPRSPANWLFGPPPVVAPAPLGAAAVRPRVVVGDVVAWRRRWQVDGAGLQPLITAATPALLVRAADDLVAGLGLPDLVFARHPGARKPVFADLRCPTSLAHLAHYLRGAGQAQLEEMLPTPAQWWLRPAGTPVSCEWRLTLGWRGPAEAPC